MAHVWSDSAAPDSHLTLEGCNDRYTWNIFPKMGSTLTAFADGILCPEFKGTELGAPNISLTEKNDISALL